MPECQRRVVRPCSFYGAARLRVCHTASCLLRHAVRRLPHCPSDANTALSPRPSTPPTHGPTAYRYWHIQTKARAVPCRAVLYRAVPTCMSLTVSRLLLLVSGRMQLVLSAPRFCSRVMSATPDVSCCVGYSTYPISTAWRGRGAGPGGGTTLCHRFGGHREVQCQSSCTVAARGTGTPGVQLVRWAESVASWGSTTHEWCAGMWGGHL